MPFAPGASRASRVPSAPLVYLVLALVWSWPLPLHLSNRFTHDPGDPLLVTYLIWWNAHAVPLTQAWWNAPFYWPLPDALALTEHLLGLSPITTPIQLLGGSPLLAYNIVLVCSVWWTGLAAHALVRRLTDSTLAAFVGGVGFAYAPYHVAQVGHLQLFACWWMPLALFALHSYIIDRQTRALVVFGMSSLLYGLTNGYAIFFLPVLLALWTLWFAPWRQQPGRVGAIALTWMLCSLPLLPVLYKYYRVQSRIGAYRPRSEMMFYSADWHSLLCATPILRFWHTSAPATTEVYLFPGLTILALTIGGAVARVRDRAFVFYALATVLFVALCFGPAGNTFSVASLWHPYDWLDWLPGFNGLRVPARFYMTATLCLAVAAALGFAHLHARVRWPRALTALVFAALFVDGSIAGMPLGAPPGRLAYRESGARVLALPYDDLHVNITTMYESMTHRMPVVNGYAGYVPPSADATNWALNREDPTLLTELRRGHPLYVIVKTSDEAAKWQRFIAAQPGVDMLGVSAGGRVYRLPPAAYAPQLPQGRAAEGVRITRTPIALVADLGRDRSIHGVELATYGVLVRLPESVHVDVSPDNVQWSMVFDNRPGGAALLGALRDPRTMPLHLQFAPVDARFVRVNAPQLGASALTVFVE